MDLALAAAQFRPARRYLDTATVGVPPDCGVAAARADLERWQSGRIQAAEYDSVVDRARVAYAQIVGARADRVGIVPQVSVASAVAASALRPGDRVLLAEEDFTSVLFPFLQTAGDVEVEVVPFDRILDAIRPKTTMVAVSAVQSADGRVLDLDGLHEVAVANDCLTYLDLTQAASWLEIGADRFDVTAVAAYKWLCSPRGTGFMTVGERMAERVTPVAAGWYAGEDPWTSIYRPPLRLATSGRRFDVSPAWSGWAAATPTLELLAEVGTEAIGRHNVALANRFRAGIALPGSSSAIVSLDQPGALDALRAADVACAGRDGRLRLSFHLYTSEDDVDAAIDIIRG